MTRRSSAVSGPAQGKLTVEQPCDLFQTIGFDSPRRQLDSKRVAAELATDIAGNPDVLIRQIDRPTARRALPEQFYGRESEQPGSRQTWPTRRGLKRGNPADISFPYPQPFPTGTIP